MSWYWQKDNKDGEWEAFSSEDNTKIETAFQKKQKSVKISHCNIDFSKMISREGEKQYTIKREETENDNASPKAKKQKTSEKPNDGTYFDEETDRSTGSSKSSNDNSAPDLLSEYKEASAAWGDYWVSGFEWGVTDQKDTLQCWLADCEDDDPRLEQISLFAQADGSGGMYGFWKYPGRTLANAPIVFLGSEGQSHLVASSVSQFIALQAAGLNGDLLCCWEGEEDEDFEPDEPTESFPKFVKWVKSKGIKSIPQKKVWKTIKQEKAVHPPLKKFLFPDEDESEQENEE